MQDSKSVVHEYPQAESDSEKRFDKSLQELRDLRSQLHYAADYCEEAFLTTKKKRIVLENTKEYLCRAVVTVVDHLGCVSANLDYRLSESNQGSETELRIDSLKQRLTTCQEFSEKLALTKVCCKPDFPRYHPRYISTIIPDVQRSAEVYRESGISAAAKDTSKHEIETEEEVPVFLYRNNCIPSLVDTSRRDSDAKKKDSCSGPVLLPVRGGPPILPRAQSFHFQEKRKLKRNMLNWKLVQSNDIISLIRRGKRI